MSCTHSHAGGACPLHGPRLSRRGFAKGLLASAAAASLAACAADPATGRRSSFGSIEDDVALGRQEHPKILAAFGGEYEDRALGSYVQTLGASIGAKTEFPNLAYRYTVLNSPIVNAFALPGGYIYVTRGLLALASNEAELAGVLGHETGHVTARHTAERQTQSIFAQLGLAILGIATGSQAVTDLASVGAVAYLQSYSRDQEMEADTLGIRYMAKAGWQPEGMVTFLATLREWSQLEARMAGRDPSSVDEYNWLATHPRTIDRVQSAMQKAAVASHEGRTNRDGYLQEIDGIRFGDDPAQGIIDGQSFRHPVLRIAFEAPSGFNLLNSENEVTAQNPNGAAFVFDMARAQSGDLAQYIAGEWAGGASVSDLRRFTVNGLDAASGFARVQGSGGQVDLIPVAIRAEGSQVYRFLFIAPGGQAGRWNGAFTAVLNSFRRISSSEAAAIKGFRIDIVNANGRSVATLARGLPFGGLNETAFRVLNDLAGGEQPGANDLVKVTRTA
jgi:predicted Zn-dependent protease